MYIEFQLKPSRPTFTPNTNVHHTLLRIKQEIEDWAAKHGVTGYSQKTIKYTHRLGFDDERYFSLFSMTWTPDIPFQLVNL